MANSIDDAHKQRWEFVNPGIPYNHDFGIPTFWRQHPELGSPIGGEIDLGGGVKCQSFTGGIVKWTPDVGAEIVTE